MELYVSVGEVRVKTDTHATPMMKVDLSAVDNLRIVEVLICFTLSETFLLESLFDNKTAT